MDLEFVTSYGKTLKVRGFVTERDVEGFDCVDLHEDTGLPNFDVRNQQQFDSLLDIAERLDLRVPSSTELHEFVLWAMQGNIAIPHCLLISATIVNGNYGLDVDSKSASIGYHDFFVGDPRHVLLFGKDDA